MTENKEKKLPVRTLHEFLFEISEAWDKFRTGSMITVVVSAVMIVFTIPRLLVLHFRRGVFLESVLYLAIILTLAYNLYVGYRQHEFYKKWERRIGVIMQAEEDLLGEDKLA
jgi:hypothetical protein